MAGQMTTYPIRGAFTKETVLVGGTFVDTEGDGSPLPLTSGLGWTVARTATGVYKVTFTKPMGNVVAVTANPYKIDVSDSELFLVSVFSYSGSEIVFHTVSDDGDGTGTLEDVAATTGVTFIAMVANTGLPVV